MAGSLAKAYVQIIPTTDGITANIENELGGAGDSAGKSAGSKFASAFKKIVVAAGFGKLLKNTLLEGAALEQSIGGVQTLFKESFRAAKKYADEAYETAGLSANAYMEITTSFAASLLQSLNGDTAKATEIANMAIVDMSDNINKMGSSIESVQDAYKGFAKQNYTMLDNLKLGYGGTKTEMERLLADAEKLSGIKYDINNLSDVYSAIHEIQEELGITGTTAIEAADTLSGSFASMKAAAKNVLGNLTLGEDVKPSLIALVGTIKTFAVDNLLPAVGNIFTGIGEIAADTVMSGIEAAREPLTSFFSGAKETIISWANENRQALTVAGIAFGTLTAAVLAFNAAAIASAAVSGAETVALIAMCAADYAVAAAKAVATAATTAFGVALNFLTSPITLVILAIGALVAGIYLLVTNWDTVKEVASKVWNKITEVWGQVSGWFKSNVVEPVKNFAVEMLAAGISFALNLKAGIDQKISDVVTAAKQLGQKALDGISSFVSETYRSGADMIQNFINGITAKAQALVAKVKSIAASVRAYLHFSEPDKGPLSDFHTYAPDMMKLFASGITDNSGVVKKAIDDVTRMTAGGFESTLGVATTLGVFADDTGRGNVQTLITLVSALSEKLDRLELRLDSGELVGGIAEKMDAALGNRNALLERGVS